MDLLFICLKLGAFKLQIGLLVSLSFGLMNTVVFTVPSLVLQLWSWAPPSPYRQVLLWTVGPPVSSCPITDVPLSLVVRVQHSGGGFPSCSVGCLPKREQHFFASLPLFFFPFQTHTFPFPLGGPGCPIGWIWGAGCLTLPRPRPVSLPSPIPDFPCPRAPTPRALPRCAVTALLLPAALAQPVLVTSALHSCSGTEPS